jgi:Uma2 family endonuclease
MTMPMQAAQALVAEFRPRWTRKRFDQLVELGAFANWDVELVRGELVEMTKQGVRHANVIEVLNELLTPLLVGRARVRVQLPLVIDDLSEVGPDLAVVDRLTGRGQHPSTALLVIEVADTSKRYDTVVKAPLYAEARVPEHWVVDVPKRAVEVFSAPRAGAYTRHTRHTRGELAVPRFPDVRVKLSELFG